MRELLRRSLAAALALGMLITGAPIAALAEEKQAMEDSGVEIMDESVVDGFEESESESIPEAAEAPQREPKDFDSKIFEGEEGYTYDKFDKEWTYCVEVEGEAITIDLSVTGNTKNKITDCYMTVSGTDDSSEARNVMFTTDKNIFCFEMKNDGRIIPTAENFEFFETLAQTNSLSVQIYDTEDGTTEDLSNRAISELRKFVKELIKQDIVACYDDRFSENEARGKNGMLTLADFVEMGKEGAFDFSFLKSDMDRGMFEFDPINREWEYLVDFRGSGNSAIGLLLHGSVYDGCGVIDLFPYMSDDIVTYGMEIRADDTIIKYNYMKLQIYEDADFVLLADQALPLFEAMAVAKEMAVNYIHMDLYADGSFALSANDVEFLNGLAAECVNRGLFESFSNEATELCAGLVEEEYIKITVESLDMEEPENGTVDVNEFNDSRYYSEDEFYKTWFCGAQKRGTDIRLIGRITCTQAGAVNDFSLEAESLNSEESPESFQFLIGYTVYSFEEGEKSMYKVLISENNIDFIRALIAAEEIDVRIKFEDGSNVVETFVFDVDEELVEFFKLCIEQDAISKYSKNGKEDVAAFETNCIYSVE